MADHSSISTNPDEASNHRRPAKSRRHARSFSQGFAVMLLVITLTILVWFLANLYQLLQNNKSDISSADSRIVVLEDRLRVTDMAMTETGQDTQEQLGLWEAEVRKLWVVANERNRSWIKENEASLARLVESFSEIEVVLRNLSSSVSRHDGAFDQQQVIIDQLTSMNLQVKALLDRQRDLIDRVNNTRQGITNMQSTLSERVFENENAIEAIDAYRLQLNNRLNNMETMLDSLARLQNTPVSTDIN